MNSSSKSPTSSVRSGLRIAIISALCGAGALFVSQRVQAHGKQAANPTAARPHRPPAAAPAQQAIPIQQVQQQNVQPRQNSNPVNPPVQTTTSTAEVADALRLGEAVSQVAENLSPAVVAISVEARQARRGVPFGPFGLPFEDGPDLARGQGSGVIFRADGAILTNHHVVQNATRVEVVLRDGRRFRATVVGSDPATDLAVIQIQQNGLPVAEFADSSRARVGEWVVAIGSPFGLDYTVTAGVLSAIGRGGLGANEIEDYLQTDASINPGNSGGPLVNLHGQVLGINTMIVGRGTGIGFAVPSSIAQNVAQQLISSGTVRRAWIGVGFQDLTPALAASFGTAQSRGALVSSVSPGGPAAAAGIQAGDIVQSVEGRPVREGRDLMREVLWRPVGGSVRIGLLRNGRSMNIALTTGERPGGDRTSPPNAPAAARPTSNGYGMQLETLNSAQAGRLGYQGTGQVIVTNVDDGSPADHSGLRRGDVIVEADRRAVTTTGDVLSSLGDGTALLRVERPNQGGQFIVLSRD